MSRTTDPPTTNISFAFFPWTATVTPWGPSTSQLGPHLTWLHIFWWYTHSKWTLQTKPSYGSKYVVVLNRHKHKFWTSDCRVCMPFCEPGSLEKTSTSDPASWNFVRYLSSPWLSWTACCYTGTNFNMDVSAKLMTGKRHVEHFVTWWMTGTFGTHFVPF